MINVVLCIVIIVMIALSAFFSGSEEAVAKFNQTRFKKYAESGNKSAKLSIKMSNNFVKTISVILLGNNLVNIISSTAATTFFTNIISEHGETVATVVTTMALLVFGEILPKILSDEFSDKIMLMAARPLHFFSILFSPIVAAVSKMMIWMSPIWTPKEVVPDVTADELVTMVDEIKDEGVFTEEESELIKSAIEFTDSTARDIMTPRVDIAAFDIDDGIEKLLSSEAMQYSVIPVYRETCDTIIGVVSTKRLIREYLQDSSVSIESLLQKPLFVHMTRTISSILNDFKKNEVQMAIVVDEFGGTMGILTIEDIVEEIVGEIYDEDDEFDAPEIEKVEENVFVVDGGTGIEELFDELGYHSADFESQYTTVGGFATEQLDRFPVEGDKFVFDSLEFTILKAKSMRVELVMIKKIEINE